MDRRSFLISGAGAAAVVGNSSLTAASPGTPATVTGDLATVKDGIRRSPQERDRRWELIREGMAREGLFAIVTAPNTGQWDSLQGDARFMSCMGGNCASMSVVFPRAGMPTVFIPGGISPDYWLAAQNWVTDIRRAGGSYAQSVISRLRELGVHDHKIGLPGITRTPRHLDGIVSTGFVAKLRESFPKADFVEAAPWLNDIRAAKSLPEIEVLRRSSDIAQIAAQVIQSEARPGVPERLVYARVTGRLLELGAEPPNMLNWISGPAERGRALGPLPTDRILRAGDLIFAEIEAVLGGYRGQATRTAVIGTPSRQVTDMFDLARSTLTKARAAMVSGAHLQDVAKVFQASAENTPYAALPIIHARGLGDDAPVFVFESADPQISSWPLKEDSTFVMKVSIQERSGPGTFLWGDIVRVTAGGAQLLGKSEMRLLVCPA